MSDADREELRIDIERLLRMFRRGHRRLYELDQKGVQRGWPYSLTIKQGRVLIHRGALLLVDTPLSTIQVREQPETNGS